MNCLPVRPMVTTNRHFRLLARAEQAAFLDLPWALALEEWPHEILVEAKRGIGRHVVRFVRVNGLFYALKELPARLAEREYRLLGELAQRTVPAVEAIASTLPPPRLNDRALFTEHRSGAYFPSRLRISTITSRWE